MNLQDSPQVPDTSTLYVLHGRPLRPGVELETTARFADDRWSLAPATTQGHERGLNLRFDNVPKLYVMALKRVCYAVLSGPLPDTEDRKRVSTVVTLYYNLRTFFGWLDQRHPRTPIADIDADILRDYQRHLLRVHRSGPRRAMLRQAVTMLWRLRGSLGASALTLDPRRLEGWPGGQRDRSSENATARIPEEVHAGLLVWAMRFVDDFSPDIVAAIERWEWLRTNPSRTQNQSGTGSRLGERIDAYLAEVRDSGGPLPGLAGRPNIRAISEIVGCNWTSVGRLRREEINALAESVGVSDHARLGLEIQGQLDGRPWLKGISLDTSRDDSLTVLTQILQAACYILIAFLSGMRDSEVKHLRSGCVSEEADSNGGTYRWTVTSLAFKGEADEEGVPATWVVGEAAARAIAALDRVQHARHHSHSAWLFAAIPCGPGSGSARRTGNVAMVTGATNRQLNRFIKWVNAYCTEHGRDDAIPDVDGQPWRLTTRQFRRTLAWFIARRPGGSIAGAIQYRHHSVQMFEGYAGTSDSGFRAEVEAEAALERGEHLLAMIDKHEHRDLHGPAADEAASRLALFEVQAGGFQGTVTSDRRRLQRLMSREDPAIYPGRYVTCVYDHTKALCRTSDEVRTAPNLSVCKPLLCRNVAIDASHREAWLHEIALIDGDLAARPMLTPLLQTHLEQRRDQIRAFLARNMESDA